MILSGPGSRLVIGCLIVSALIACREEPLSHEQIVRDDLSEIMALQNMPCGAVTDFVPEGHLDYRIECENGRSYRIHVSVEGHVNVNTHAPESPQSVPDG